MKKYTVYFEAVISPRVEPTMYEAVYYCEDADEAEDQFRAEFGFDHVYIDQIIRS